MSAASSTSRPPSQDYSNTFIWSIVDLYFKNTPYFLTKHHLDSFHDFISYKIPTTISQLNPLSNSKEIDPVSKKPKYKIDIYFGGRDGKSIYLGKPAIFDHTLQPPSAKQMYPNEARLRNLTYASTLTCDIEIKYTINDREHFAEPMKGVMLGKIPIMLHSKYCVLHNMSSSMLTQVGESPIEQGGYFIIKGKEKVIISQERMGVNQVYLAPTPNDELYDFKAEIRSVPEQSSQAPRITTVFRKRKDKTFFVDVPNLRKPIPLFVLFRALGLESDKEILDYILFNIGDEGKAQFLTVLRPSILDAQPLLNSSLAFLLVIQLTKWKSMGQAHQVLKSDFLPHVGSDFKSKIFFLGYMVHGICKLVLGQIQATDRDSFSFKRVDLSGVLLSRLFREYYQTFRARCNKAIDNIYNYNKSLYQDQDFLRVIDEANRFKIFNPNIIENGLLKSIRGSWGAGTKKVIQGLVQDLNRFSFYATMSHLRRINLPLPSSAKVVAPRQLHGTQWGIICPVETPDGGNIGKIKNMSITAHISAGCFSGPIIEALRELGMVFLNEIVYQEISASFRIMLNGNWIGVHFQPIEMVHNFRLFRRNGLINLFVSIEANIPDQQINVWTDAGRLLRPVLVAKNHDLLIDPSKISQLRWDHLLAGTGDYVPFNPNLNSFISPSSLMDVRDTKKVFERLDSTQAAIEFIDVAEENASLIAMYPQNLASKQPFTHCEIHPSLILGIMAIIIPFVQHNQSPRNLFSSGQSKQSIGAYAVNYRNRLDQTAYVLNYPQTPLVNTRYAQYINRNLAPYGINAIVAVATYTGYNQEDSIIFNHDSIKRGLFRSTNFHTYSSEETQSSLYQSDSLFGNPLEEGVEHLQPGKNYQKLDSRGMIAQGDTVEEDDIIVGKFNKVEGPEGMELMDASLGVKKKTDGWVDKAFMDIDEQGNRLAKVCIREERIPTLGDKFSSRAAQKGTIGMVLPQEDMPFTREGIVPDMIINPHAFPSRMTIGQFLECVACKVCSVAGFTADATPFSETVNPVGLMGDILQNKLGYERYGNELMYNGRTGEQLKVDIFIGPTYYMRLKHLTLDKYNSRAAGPVTNKTRQPPEGKARGGGLRIGEMERDVLLSHGMAYFLKESFMERSDKFQFYINKNTGLITPANPPQNIYPKDNFGLVQAPYSLKLLIQELEGMAVAPRLLLE